MKKLSSPEFGRKKYLSGRTCKKNKITEPQYIKFNVAVEILTSTRGERNLGLEQPSNPPPPPTENEN